MFALDTENGTKEEKKARLEKATQELKDGEYYHIYMPNFSIDKVQAIAKKFKLQKNLYKQYSSIILNFQVAKLQD